MGHVEPAGAARGVRVRGLTRDDADAEDVATEGEAGSAKSSACRRADAIRASRCKYLIAVIENPAEPRNIGAVLHNVNAVGVEKVYVVIPRCKLPADWHGMR